MKKPSYLYMLLAMGIVLIAPNAYGQEDADDEHSSVTTVTTHRGGTKISLRGVGNSFDVNYDGEIRFNDDFTDIAYISPGGYVNIQKTSFGNRRKLELDGGSGGQITRKFYDGGNEKPYEPNGRRFLEEMLPEILNNTRLGAQDRVAKSYEKAGAQGVVDLVDGIDSDYLATHYIQLAFDLPGLRDRDRVRFIKLAADDIDSDFELSRLLSEVGPEMLEDADTEDAFMEAITEIDSDFEIARLLSDLSLAYDLTDERMVDILVSMDSDFEKSRILNEAIEIEDITIEQVHSVLELLQHIESDFEKARVMHTVVQKQALELEGVHLVVDRLGELDSDFEQARVLKELISLHELETEAAMLALDALDNIESDFEKARILETMLEDERYSKEAIEELLERIDKVDSDFERARLLEQVLESGVEHSFDSMINSIDRVDSDFERANLLKAAATQEGLSGKDYELIIDASKDLGDWECKNVLLVVIEHMPNNDTLEQMVKDAARTLGDHEYGQIMRALDSN